MRTIVALLAVYGVGAAEHTLTAVLVDHAGVPAEVLTKAESHYIRVFGKAGIEARWVQPSVRNGRVVVDASAVVIHVLLGSQTNQYPHAGQNYLGKAFAASPDQPVDTVVVFYDHIQQVMALREFDLAPVLAHVMAHETGHLLLGPRHSVAGIMKEAWSDKDYYHIKQGFGLFTDGERWRLKDALHRRHSRLAQTRQGVHHGAEAMGGR